MCKSVLRPYQLSLSMCKLRQLTLSTGLYPIRNMSMVEISRPRRKSRWDPDSQTGKVPELSSAMTPVEILHAITADSVTGFQRKVLGAKAWPTMWGFARIHRAQPIGLWWQKAYDEFEKIADLAILIS